MIKRDFCKWRFFINVGITFKENCPDVRILRSSTLFRLWSIMVLQFYNDPVADPDAVLKRYGITVHYLIAHV
jgi:hypothetical protein